MLFYNSDKDYPKLSIPDLRLGHQPLFPWASAHWRPKVRKVSVPCLEHVMQFLVRNAESFGGASNATFISLKGMFDQMMFE